MDDEMPEVAQPFNFKHVYKLATDVMHQRANGDHWVDEDMKEYIYEAVMEAIYGPDFWTWFNLKGR